MPDDGSLCAGARAPRSPLPLAPEPPAGAEALLADPGTPRRRVSGTRHSPGTKVCLSEVTAARSRHPGQVHSIVTSCGNLHWPGMRLCSLSVRTRLRLHPMQVRRPPRTGAGLLPGGVGAGTPAGKFCERHPGVEGGVIALCALVGSSEGESTASGDPPPDALFFFSLLSRSSQPLAMSWHSLGGHLAASRALSPGAPLGHSRFA